jgi:hypothetical protein
VRVIPENDPPGAFQIVEPISLEWGQRLQFSGRDTLITFTWQSSPNPDPGDEVFYTWQLLDTTRHILQELPAGSETYVTAYMDTSGIFLWSVLARDRAGLVTASDTLPFLLESLGGDYQEGGTELTFSFGPNYPNPFGNRTHIEYAIPRFSNVIITVYDAMGRKVRVLRAEPHYRGRYLVEWDGRDSQGQPVASGPYVAEIRAGSNSAYLKLVVVH